jgi:hypothetical protein
MSRVFQASAPAFFLWGVLLGLAPLVAGVVTWRHAPDVWLVATSSGLAACAVVGLFAASAGRRL